MARILTFGLMVVVVIVGLVWYGTWSASTGARTAEDRAAIEASGTPATPGSASNAAAPAPVNNVTAPGNQVTTVPATAPAVVAPPSLPRPSVATEHPALQRFVDTSASSRFGSDFPSLVPTVTDPADIAWVVYVLRDHTDLDAVRNEAANLLHRSQVPGLEDHLLAVLDSPHEKPRFQSYAVQHLGNLLEEFRATNTEATAARERAVAAGVAQALQSPHVMVRSEALLILARERDPRAAQVIRSQLTAATTDYPQDILINCAKDAGLRDLIPDIRPLAYAQNTVVRIAAINALAEWKDDASRPAFEEASRSTVPRLQRAGKLALSLIDQPN